MDEQTGGAYWAKRGPHLWAVLHKWALSADLPGAPHWLLEFDSRIGCALCRADWERWRADHPPDCSTREALFAWTVRAHNEVNCGLGKPQLEVEIALRQWQREVSMEPGIMNDITRVPTAAEVLSGPGFVEESAADELVDCEHAAPSSVPHAVACGMGLYGGLPHFAICRTCQWRVPRKNPPEPPVPVVMPPANGQVVTEAPQNAVRQNEPAAADRVPAAERLILRSHLSPGDVLMLTAAVRDLHRAFPNRFITAVETSVPELWENNPLVWAHGRAQRAWRVIEMQYPLIHQSNQRPVHFLQGYAEFLGAELGVSIPITSFRGDIYLTTAEKEWMNQVRERFEYGGRFWIIMAGGKHDLTAKWWPTSYYQQVVDHFMGRIQFVQCGQGDHWHPPLRGVFNLVGQTSIRQFVRLVYHADGVICPVTFAMHLAAAVPTKDARLRPCIVIAGGREPPHWEAYPGHQFLHTVGSLPCCATGGCWKSRCQKVGDGDANDTQNLCERPVQIEPKLNIPQCMVMIQPQDVIRAVERALTYGIQR